jgi:prevent-host-death family protein
VTNILVRRCDVTTVTLADAKTHLSELVSQAESGEPVSITRRGKLVARLTTVKTTRRPITLATLRTVTESMPKQAEPAGDFVRRMRDESRY